MRFLAPTAFAAALTAPAFAAEPATGPIQLTPGQRAAVEEAVRSDLKDPNSALFGAMVAAQDVGRMMTVCGWVNAKNSYGGYTGEKPFYGLLISGPHKDTGVLVNIFSPMKIGGDDIDTSVTFTMCSQNGIQMGY